MAGWSTTSSTAQSAGGPARLAAAYKAGSQLHYSRELRAEAEQLLGCGYSK
jgi:hypothetical protein